MKRTTIWIVVIIVVMVLGLCIFKYNTIATKDQSLENAWAPLLNVLQPRYDEVPKFVNEIILYTGKEDDETKKLSSAYKNFKADSGFNGQIEDAGKIESALSKVIIDAGQRYPGITSHYQFINLKEGFQQTTTQMKPLVDAYNKAADDYNTYVRLFPNNFVALIMGFDFKAPYFMRNE